MGKRIAFSYLTCLVLRSDTGCDVVAVQFPGTCPGFPSLEAQLTKFLLKFGKVKSLHLLQNAIHSLPYLFPIGFAYVL